MIKPQTGRMSLTSEQKPQIPPLRPRKAPLRPSPKPSRQNLLSLAVIALGYFVGLAAPWLVVSPTQPHAPMTKVLLAFGLTLLGVAISLAAGGLAFWRERTYGWLIITWMPAVALVAGGAILTASKLR